jgi:hypothetical protein
MAEWLNKLLTFDKYNITDMGFCPNIPTLNGKGGRRGHDHDRMVVGFITTCAISAYHH